MWTQAGGAAGAIVGKRIGDEIDAGAMGLAGTKSRLPVHLIGPGYPQKRASRAQGARNSL